eukprot:5963536-Pleurochrysis_carterae.AAC.2
MSALILSPSRRRHSASCAASTRWTRLNGAHATRMAERAEPVQAARPSSATKRGRRHGGNRLSAQQVASILSQVLNASFSSVEGASWLFLRFTSRVRNANPTVMSTAQSKKKPHCMKP